MGGGDQGVSRGEGVEREIEVLGFEGGGLEYFFKRGGINLFWMGAPRGYKLDRVRWPKKVSAR